MKKKIAKTAHDVSPAQEAQLEKLEAIIARGIGTFIEVGVALETIKRDELYRVAGFAKFTEYYETKWGYDKSYISRLMSAAALGQAIREEMPKLNLLESHVRELAPLVKSEKGKPKDFGPAIQLVEKLTAGGKRLLTAEKIKAVVSKGRRSQAVRAMNPAASSAAFETIDVIKSPQEARELLGLLRTALKDWTKTWPRLNRPKKFRGYDQPVRTAIAKLELIDAWLATQVEPTINSKSTLRD